MHPNHKKNIVKIPLLLSLISLLLVGVGCFFGYYLTVRLFRMKIETFSQAATLGKLLNEQQKTATSQAYYDPATVVQEIDRYSWTIPTVVTPFVGHGNKPGRHNNAEINSMQFRAEQELVVPKPPNTYRIFITGGSTAFSSGAPSQDRTIAAYLSRLLTTRQTPTTQRNYEVFTMATPAWASSHERIIIENRLSELEPDLVISLSGNNDVHWGVQGRNIFWFRSYSDEFYWDLLNTVYFLAGFEKMPDVVPIDATPVAPIVVAERLEKNIRLSSYVLSLENIPYVFCLQPTIAVTKKNLTDREIRASKVLKEYFRACYQEIESRLSQLQIESFIYCNLATIFDQRSKQEEIFVDSYHFGDKGNEIIAENVYQCIKDTVVSSLKLSKPHHQEEVPVKSGRDSHGRGLPSTTSSSTTNATAP